MGTLLIAQFHSPRCGNQKLVTFVACEGDFSAELCKHRNSLYVQLPPLESPKYPTGTTGRLRAHAYFSHKPQQSGYPAPSLISSLSMLGPTLARRSQRPNNLPVHRWPRCARPNTRMNRAPRRGAGYSGVKCHEYSIYNRNSRCKQTLPLLLRQDGPV